jgi:predicted dehydrogenase
MARPRLGIAVIGFGWMGQAHSRSCLRIPTLFHDAAFEARLVVCADTDERRRRLALESFGFTRAVAEWRMAVEDGEVDIVFVTAPNALHVEIVEAAAAAGKAIFCEKPVGGTPPQTARAAAAARRSGVITGVGFNYRFAPLVRYAERLISSGRLGEVQAYRGRFLSMYGADELAPLTWRFLRAEAGYGASSDLLSHAVDLAHFLVGPIDRLVADVATFIPERPIPGPEPGGHYGRGAPTDERRAVTNEDYAGLLCVFEGGARGSFDTSRTLVGPQSEMAFELYASEGALRWSLERLNELEVSLAGEPERADRGWTTVLAGDRFPPHGLFAPGGGNGIGFEDLVTIEDHAFLTAVAAGESHVPGFDEALAWSAVQEALFASVESGGWCGVVPLSMADVR